MNSQVTLKCEAEAHPNPSFLWYKHGRHVIDDTNTNDSMSTLTVKLQTEHDFGNYTCKAKNEFGVSRVYYSLMEGKVPSPPENLYVIGRGYNILDMGFKAKESQKEETTMFPVLKYQFQYIAKDDFYNESSWDDAKLHKANFGEKNYQINDLKENSRYLVRVAAENDLGLSEWSDPEEFDTLEKEVEILKNDRNQSKKSMIVDVTNNFAGTKKIPFVSIISVVIILALHNQQ
jgi:hypothetical protein